MPTIKTSKFVKRQTKESEFSYYDGTWSDLENITKAYFQSARDGYRDGVKLVPVKRFNPHFYSAVVPITDDLEFTTIFEARRDGEKPVKKSVSYGKKSVAKYVDIVIYRKDVLEEDPLNIAHMTGAEWEIVSINCSPYEYDLPMTPDTIARNILACTDHPFGKGGTCDTKTSAIDLAKSIAFWKTHTQVRERPQMDQESIKARYLEVLWQKLLQKSYAPKSDEKTAKEMFDDYIQKNGGWQAIINAVGKGVFIGRTVDDIFAELSEKL
jgi:hypothetical protein